MNVDLTLYAAEVVKTGTRVGQIWPPRLPVHGAVWRKVQGLIYF